MGNLRIFSLIINKPIFEIGKTFPIEHFKKLCDNAKQLSFDNHIAIYKIVRSRPRFLRSSWDYFVGTDPKNLQRYSEKELQKLEKI